MRAFDALVFVVCSVIGLGCVFDARDEEVAPSKARSAITNGGEVDGDPAVVALSYELGEGRTRIGCSGILVAPTRVLTAAHCAVPLAPTRALFGSRLSEQREERAVVGNIVHPDYDAYGLESDLAVLVIDAAPVTPVDLPIPARSPGATVRIVGFGRTEASAPVAKRSGVGRVAKTHDRGFDIEPGPSLICAGDSGGPGFAVVDEKEVLVGIASRGDPSCALRGTFTSLAGQEDFLRSSLEDHETSSSCRVVGPTHGGGTIPLLFVVIVLLRVVRRVRSRG
jgi:secreted trypsin-like serine protease